MAGISFLWPNVFDVYRFLEKQQKHSHSVSVYNYIIILAHTRVACWPDSFCLASSNLDLWGCSRQEPQKCTWMIDLGKCWWCDLWQLYKLFTRVLQAIPLPKRQNFSTRFDVQSCSVGTCRVGTRCTIFFLSRSAGVEKIFGEVRAEAKEALARWLHVFVSQKSRAMLNALCSIFLRPVEEAVIKRNKVNKLM